MRRAIRTLPWLLALVGLAIPLIGDTATVWPWIAAWLVVLGLARLVGPGLLRTRDHRMSAALILLPVLFMLAWWGGWWLIPADLAWFAIEVLDRGHEVTAPDTAG